MILIKNPRLFFALAGILLATTCNAQKQVKYEYSGGHGCINLSLLLYKDSSFLFERETAIAFVIRSREKGKYLLCDSAITLFNRKRFYFLHFKEENRYRKYVYRIRNNDILLYPESAEQSKDADYIKAYNTMYLVKG